MYDIMKKFRNNRMMNYWLDEFVSYINCKKIKKCKELSYKEFLSDYKYYVEIENKKAFLLQVSDNDFSDIKRNEYDAVCYD